MRKMTKNEHLRFSTDETGDHMIECERRLQWDELKI